MLPPGLAAVLGALRFEDPRPEWLRVLDEREWRRTLDLCDRAQLTLPLAERRQDVLPEWVRVRVRNDIQNTEARTRTIRQEFRQIAEGLQGAGIEFAVLKGFSGWPDFLPDPARRVQYDLDLYLTPAQAQNARDVLMGLGFEPLSEMETFPTDHLPVMVRKTGWQWRGDFFDPEIPLSIDLHFRLWDRDTERFDAPGWEEFWGRRVSKQWERIRFSALHPADALAYASLHALRHVLRGSLRPAHIYEIAWFLHGRAEDTAFWEQWQSLHGPDLRKLQAVVFRLAREWFACGHSALVQEEIAKLAESTARWFDRYAFSPVEALTHPNKHELWLHLSMLTSWTDRVRVMRRRVAPAKLPGPVDSVFVPAHQLTVWLRWRRRLRFAIHVLRRVIHHTRVLPPVAWHGARWAWAGSAAARMGAGYWRFLGACAIFNLGSFVFFVLYNLFLLDLGYREDMLGLLSGTMTAGSIAGTLPAGALARRIGLRRMLVLCFLAMAGTSVCRILFTHRAPLMGFAFAAGVSFALFAVAVAPAIAQLSDAQARPRAFSIFFATGISIGIAGGLLGGQLPGAVGSKQAALLIGCGLMVIGAIAAASLRFSPPPGGEARVYPKGAFLWRFLPVMAAWSFATGAFNPFFSAFFAKRVGATVEQIGMTYSSAQLAQVAAILAAPLLLRRAGLVNGVAATQVACGLALAAVGLTAAGSQGVFAPALAYAAYMGLHFMGEPGLYSLMMNRVAPAQQSGASALSHMAIFAGQAVAAVGAGAAVVAIGYGGVIAAASALAMLAGLLLWRLLPEETGD